MSWPLPQDFNEAVQNPAISFSDPDLMTGQAVVGPTGLPLPRSGNFADVYQVRAANGRDWAVKCFTRPVTGLDQRYRKLDEALKKAGLPFTIGFAFLNQGVMVHGKWHPALKMEWVDGLQLNQAVRVQAGSPKVLDALVQMWSRLCKKLREAGIAHADLQHGNVLLVAGSKAGSYSLKLIDYDGMFTPSLANTPSGESGHPNYQHPQRAAKGVYSPDLDRFPHLVIATALKGLAVCGAKLWEKYDTGDNLLFTEDDFKTPASSSLMKELWEKNDPALQTLVGHLAIACGKAIPQTPWLDQIAPEGVPIQLTPEQARAAAAALGVPPPAWANVVVPVAPAEYSVELVAPAPLPPPPPANAFSNLEDSDEVVPVEPKPRRRVRDEEPAEKKKSLALPLAIGGGVLALVLAVVVGIVVFGGNKPDEIAQQKNDDDKDKEKEKPKLPPVKEKEKPKPPDPTPPDPTPPKKPIEPPMPEPAGFNFDPANVSELKARWTGTTTGNAVIARFTANGEYVIARDGTAKDAKAKDVRVYAATSGTALTSFTEGVTNLVDFACLSDGNVASWHLDQPFAFVWNPATAKKASRLPVRAPADNAGPKLFDVSPDGRYVVAGHAMSAKSPDLGSIVVSEVESGKELLSAPVRHPKFRFHNDQFILADVEQVQFYRLPGGQPGRSVKFGNVSKTGRMLGCTADGSLVLHPGNGHPQLIDCRGAGVLAVFPTRFTSSHGALSDDGRFAATISPQDRVNGEPMAHIEVLDIAGKKLLGRFILGQAPDVTSMAFAPDNSALVITRSGRRVQVIDLPKSGAVAVLPKMKDPDPMPKDPPGAGEGWVERWSRPVKDKRTRVWFTSNDKNVVVHDPRSPPWQLDVYDASNGVGRTAMASGKPPGILMEKVSLLEDGRLFAMSGIGEFFEWNFKTGEPLKASIEASWIPREGDRSLPVVEYAPNGRYVFIGKNAVRTPRPGQPPQVEPAPYRLIEVATGNPVSSGDWDGGRAMFSGDSKWLVVHDLRGRLFRINAASGKAEKAWEFTDNNARLTSVSRDGSIAMIDANLENRFRTLHVADLTASRVLMAVPPTPYASIGMLTPDGKHCIAGLLRQRGGGQRTAFDLNVYEVATGKRVRQAQFDSLDNALSLQIASDLGSFAMVDQEAMKAVVYEFKDGAVAVVPKMKDPDPPVPMPKPKDPPTPMPTPKIERVAIPEAAAITKAEMKLHTLFKDEYAKKEPADRRSFATKLLGLADGENDDAAQRYVMYRDSRDIAIELFEAPLAMRALDGIFRHYTADTDAIRLETFEKIKNQPKVNITALKNVAEFALGASESALAADNYGYALKYAQTAADAVKRGNLAATLRDEAAALTAKAQKGAETFKPVQQAIEELARNPGNRDAAYTVGLYRCFQQGRWDEGIKNLAAGAVGDVKTAALQDAAAPRTGPADVKIADAWWQASQKAIDTLEKQGSLYRARHWYALALPSLKDDARKTAESRLAFSAGGTDYKPGLIAGFTAKVPAILKDQKARVDSVLDFNAGEFKGTDASGAATDLEVKWNGSLLAQRAGRFRIAVAATDPVVVRIDGRIVIDTTSKGARLDAMVPLTDRPVAIEVSFKSINTDRHSVKLLWSLPGMEAEELIPPEALIHDKKAESVLGKSP